jgi:hypothetical protein
MEFYIYIYIYIYDIRGVNSNKYLYCSPVGYDTISSLVGRYQCFEDTYCVHLQDMSGMRQHENKAMRNLSKDSWCAGRGTSL